jgi:hypothetical protein
MGHAGHARRSVYVEPDQTGTGDSGLTGVHAHPDPDLPAGGPTVVGEVALYVDHSRHTFPGGGENGKEPVPVGVHFSAAVGREPSADDRPVVL